MMNEDNQNYRRVVRVKPQRIDDSPEREDGTMNQSGYLQMRDSSEEKEQYDLFGKVRGIG